MPAGTNDRLAVLIDAENAQASLVGELLAEISRYGVASVKRAYGDWTTATLRGWKAHLHRHAIQPIQQFTYTTGKNASDSALIIDAMDLLHSGNFDGFCLVSSDSDFTRLATRLRESGVAVYGFGESKTPSRSCRRAIASSSLRFSSRSTWARRLLPDWPDCRSKRCSPSQSRRACATTAGRSLLRWGRTSARRTRRSTRATTGTPS
jgi:uncharacterized LabA/DUF88 family protein